MALLLWRESSGQGTRQPHDDARIDCRRACDKSSEGPRPFEPDSSKPIRRVERPTNAEKAQDWRDGIRGADGCENVLHGPDLPGHAVGEVRTIASADVEPFFVAERRAAVVDPDDAVIVLRIHDEQASWGNNEVIDVAPGAWDAPIAQGNHARDADRGSNLLLSAGAISPGTRRLWRPEYRENQSAQSFAPPLPGLGLPHFLAPHVFTQGRSARCPDIEMPGLELRGACRTGQAADSLGLRVVEAFRAFTQQRTAQDASAGELDSEPPQFRGCGSGSAIGHGGECRAPRGRDECPVLPRLRSPRPHRARPDPLGLQVYAGRCS